MKKTLMILIGACLVGSLAGCYVEQKRTLEPGFFSGGQPPQPQKEDK